MTSIQQKRTDGDEQLIVESLHGCRRFYILFIDGTKYKVHQQSMTGAEIMQLGGIPQEVGLIRILEDGTEVQVRPDDVVNFKKSGKFKRAPRFKRG